LRWKTSVDGFGVAIDLTASQMYAAPWCSFIVRAMAAFAACAVIGRPVWNVTPLRSVNVHVLPSFDFATLVASSGLIFFARES